MRVSASAWLPTQLPEGASVVSIAIAEDADAVLVTIQGVGLQLQQVNPHPLPIPQYHTREILRTEKG